MSDEIRQTAGEPAKGATMKEYNARQVFLMSLPIFAELLLQLLVGNVDQIMISRYSQAGVAAIGNGNQIINIIVIFISSMSAAATIMLSQYIGAKDEKRAGDVCHVAFLVVGGASLAASLALFLFWRPLFSWLRISADVVPDARNYLLTVGAFIVVQGCYMTFTAILRSYAYLREILIMALVMNGLNIAGNAVLINGLFGMPRLGVLGAAISTDLSKCVGLAIAARIYARRVGIPLRLSRLRPFPGAVCRRMLFFALPTGGESLSYDLSQAFILRFVNLFGTAVVATKVYCSILANVAYVYSIAISQATQIVVGYLVGEQRSDRIGRRVWMAVGIALAVSLSITALLWCNSDRVFGLFTQDRSVWALGRTILAIEFFLEIGRSVNIVMVRALVATGDVRLPVGAGIVSCWAVAVAGAWLLGVHFGMGLPGIWIAMAIDEALRGAVFSVRFLTGGWRKHLPAAL